MDYSAVYRNVPRYYPQLGFFAATLCYLSYYDRLVHVDRLRTGLGANEITSFPLQNDYVPRCLLVRSSNGYIVSVEGTTTGTQWLGYLVNAGMASIPGIAGQVFTPFKDIGLAIALQVQSQVDVHYPIFLTGHSLGGAAALVAAKILKHRGYNVKTVMTFGAPRVCDDDFADAFLIPAFQVFHRDDPVPNLPPLWSTRFAGLFPGAPAIPRLNNLGEYEALHDPNQRVALFNPVSWVLSHTVGAVVPRFSRHLVGLYCSLTWRQISRVARREMGVLYWALQRQGFRLP